MAVSGPGTPVPGKHHRRQKGDVHRGAPWCVSRDMKQWGLEEAVTCGRREAGQWLAPPRQCGHPSSDLTGITVRQDRMGGAWSHTREREQNHGNTGMGRSHNKAVGSASSVSFPSVVK